jgi:hypothetical protein
MSFRILILLVGSLLLLASSGALAQDPNNAYIPDIQNGVYPVNSILTVRGVVVTGLAPFGLWVQEPAPTGFPRSGIWCYTGSTPQVEIGDKVRVKGKYIEYFDLTELDVPAGGGTVTLEGTVTVPQPPLLDVNTIHTGSPTAEDWEGVLVKVDSVRVTFLQSFGQYTVIEIDEDSTTTFPPDTLTCDDTSLTAPPRPPVGSVFDFMTGIVHYSFGEHKMNPRDNDDFDWASGEPAPGVEIAYCTSNTQVDVRFDRDVDPVSAGDELNYFFNNLGEFPTNAVRDAVEHDLVHLTVATAFVPNNPVPEILDVSGVKNEEQVVMPATVSKTFIGGVSTIDFVQGTGNASPIASQVVTVTGIVTGDNSHDYFGADGSRFYLEKPGGGPRSGIFVFDRRHLVNRGDQLKVAGTVLEFNRKTEIDDPVYVQVMASGQPIPGPDVVTAATLRDTLTAEPYEGVFVRLNNVVVADTANVFGEWPVKPAATPDTVLVGDEGLYFYVPDPGDPLPFVQGPLDFAFGTFRIQPRSPFDIATNGVAVEDQGVPGAVRVTELRGNAPNPFNPATEIRFALRETGPVDLAIYDLNGRLVRTLSNGARLPAGDHAVAWDGRSDSGKELPSGLYLVRFEAGGVEAAHKITLMK